MFSSLLFSHYKKYYVCTISSSLSTHFPRIQPGMFGILVSRIWYNVLYNFVKFDHTALVCENWPIGRLLVLMRLKNICLCLHNEIQWKAPEVVLKQWGDGALKRNRNEKRKNMPSAEARVPYSTEFILLVLLSWRKCALAASKESREEWRKPPESHKMAAFLITSL